MNGEYIKAMEFENIFPLWNLNLKKPLKTKSLDLRKITALLQKTYELLNDVAYSISLTNFGIYYGACVHKNENDGRKLNPFKP